MWLAPRRDPIGLYLHIPFCERRCHFCAFFTRGYRDERAAAFVEDLLAEIRLYGALPALRERSVETVYFGGGTPTTLSPDQLDTLLAECRVYFPFAPSAEIGLEANPSGINVDVLSRLHDAGFNRLSFGAQSFDDDELKAIGSPHTAADICDGVHAARRAGFQNVSLDLIYGLPGQTMDRLTTNLQHAAQLEPEHISLYGFTLEEGTRFADDAERGRLDLPGDDLAAEMYDAGRELLEAGGYVQYEVSNFARPGHACRHNLGYWTDQEWLGLGPSAHSYLDGERFSNIAGLDAYHDHLTHRRVPVSERETADFERRMREAIAFGLRRVEGVKLKPLLARYGLVSAGHFQGPINRLVSGGWLECDGETVRATKAGLAVADELAMAFL